MLQVPEWSPQYAISIRSLDLDNQSLFKLAETLRGMRGETLSPSDMGEVINCLVNYALDHFKLEEQYMESVGFKNLREHRREHNRFAVAVHAMKNLHAGDPETVTVDKVMGFLVPWLNDHTIAKDTGLAPYFSKDPVRLRARVRVDSCLPRVPH